MHKLHPQQVPPRHPLPGLQASLHAHLHLAPQLPAPPLRRQQPLPVAPFPDFQAPSSSIPFPLVLLHPPGLHPASRRRPVFGAPISERISAASTSGPAPVQSASSVPSASASQQLDPLVTTGQLRGRSYAQDGNHEGTSGQTHNLPAPPTTESSFGYEILMELFFF